MACALLTPQDVRWLLTALFGFLGTLGLVFTLLYHLGRYAPGSQYRERLPFLQDLRACLPRGLLHLFFWPFVIALDSGALPRALQGLRVLFGSRAGPRPDLPPAPDRTDFASAAALRYVEEAELARARVHETAGGVERRRRLVILPHDSPELDRAWLLIGLARGPSGTVSLVRLYQEDNLVAEVAEHARIEAGLRRAWRCEWCGAGLKPADVQVPEPVFLRVVGQDGASPVVEGWALRGRTTVGFRPCAACGKQRPPLTEDLALLGPASEVVAAVRQGAIFQTDVP